MWKFLSSITKNLPIAIPVMMVTGFLFGIIPFLAYFVGLIFFKTNPYMALGLLLAGLVPTSGMTISWTGFAKGNLEASAGIDHIQSPVSDGKTDKITGACRKPPILNLGIAIRALISRIFATTRIFYQTF